MPRPRRRDYPGSFHHVMGRGIAHRPIFQTREDIRYFLSLLAREVRAGRIRLLAYVILTTHFHLLVECPTGELSDSMQWILDLYARWFNRTRQRDGPVFRGRFCSKPIRSRAHWLAAVMYIDRNAVEAGLVAHPCDYEHGSAAAYSRKQGPSWLHRGPIERVVNGILGGEEYDGEAYRRFASLRLGPAAKSLLESELARHGSETPPLDDLIRGAPGFVQRWMQSNAANADGLPAGIMLVTPDTVRRRAACVAASGFPGMLQLGTRKRSTMRLLEAGLLRCLSGLPLTSISAILGCSRSTAEERILDHARAVRLREDYAEMAARVAECAIADDYGEVLRAEIRWEPPPVA